jgi:hypothetical protein
MLSTVRLLRASKGTLDEDAHLSAGIDNCFREIFIETIRRQ